MNTVIVLKDYEEVLSVFFFFFSIGLKRKENKNRTIAKNFCVIVMNFEL